MTDGMTKEDRAPIGRIMSQIQWENDRLHQQMSAKQALKTMRRLEEEKHRGKTTHRINQYTTACGSAEFIKDLMKKYRERKNGY